jgi:Alanine-zipper, major outer membrane lipoprotein
MIMTQDKARKTATRQRMAATGEPYCEARRATEAAADPGTPREENSCARMAEESGLSVAEVRAQEIVALAREQAAEARDRADEAEELAERARERSEQAEEAAMMAHEAADMAAEAAAMTRDWADPDEREQARARAEAARTRAHEAQRRADDAERAADRAQEVAGEAEEAAEEAEEFADEAQDRAGAFGGGPDEHVRRADGTDGRPDTGGWDRPGPPRPPKPPKPPRSPGHPGGFGDFGFGPDLGVRIGQVLRRFDVLRGQAEDIVSRAERMFGPGPRRSRPGLTGS